MPQDPADHVALMAVTSTGQEDASSSASEFTAAGASQDPRAQAAEEASVVWEEASDDVSPELEEVQMYETMWQVLCCRGWVSGVAEVEVGSTGHLQAPCWAPAGLCGRRGHPSPTSSGQWNSRGTLPHCLEAMGSGTRAVHCCTTVEHWAVELLRYTAALPPGGMFIPSTTAVLRGRCPLWC